MPRVHLEMQCRASKCCEELAEGYLGPLMSHGNLPLETPNLLKRILPFLRGHSSPRVYDFMSVT